MRDSSNVRKNVFRGLPMMLCAGLLILGGCAEVAQDNTGVEVSVSGEGRVMASPDLAVVNASLRLQGRDSRPLLKQAEQVLTSVLAALRQSGIEDKAIDAGQLNLQQRWQYTDGKRQSDGYEVQRPLRISLKNIADYPQLIDTLSAQGINTIDGISFDYSNREQLMDEATTAAVTDAQRKAAVLGKGVGAPDCRAVQISIGTMHVPVARLEMVKMSAADSQSAYNPGEQQLNASVSAVFRCR